jgi:hypothetical protein
MMYQWASHEKKMFKKIASLKSVKKGSDPELDPDPEPDPDPLVRGTDPGIRIRIRTKMSRSPKTAINIYKYVPESQMSAE